MRILTPLLVSPPFDLQFGSNIDGFVPPMFEIHRIRVGDIIRNDVGESKRVSSGDINRHSVGEITRQGTIEIGR